MIPAAPSLRPMPHGFGRLPKSLNTGGFATYSLGPSRQLSLLSCSCTIGKAGFIECFVMTFSAMPDFRHTVKRIVADGDQVWVSTTSATHTGGPWLDVPPTGKKLHFDVVDMFRVENGKVAEHWDVADTLGLFSQLGKVKVP
jgi:predicted ester cyclase